MRDEVTMINVTSALSYNNKHYLVMISTLEPLSGTCLDFYIYDIFVIKDTKCPRVKEQLPKSFHVQDHGNSTGCCLIPEVMSGMVQER